MANPYVQKTRAAASRYGVPVDLFLAQIKQESNFDPKAKSYANAQGIAQIVPRWHPNVDPYDPDAALEYAARWMKELYKKHGSWEKALSVYNSGKPDAYRDPKFSGGQTYNYVRRIMDGRAQWSPGGVLPSPPGPSIPSRKLTGTTAPTAAGSVVQEPFDFAPLQAVMDANNATLGLPALTLPPLPAMPQRAALPVALPPALPPGRGNKPAQNEPWTKWVGRPEKRSGPSKPHTLEILQFVGKVGQIARTKLTPWGNESHSLTTVNGTPSAHGSGHAADIPATGKELVRLGQAALIAAGMPARQARKQKGGLFNVNGFQVIFATQIGGNHADHVHVGIRR